MATRYVLTDEMWAELEPLLPDRTPRRGGRWRDHREVVEAIIWRFRTGSPWRDLPEDFPPVSTVWGRFDAWSGNGIWDQVLRRLQGHAHAVGELEWTVSVDSTIARAHQHAAGARRSSVDVVVAGEADPAGAGEGCDVVPAPQDTGGETELQGSLARAC